MDRFCPLCASALKTEAPVDASASPTRYFCVECQIAWLPDATGWLCEAS